MTTSLAAVAKPDDSCYMTRGNLRRKVCRNYIVLNQKDGKGSCDGDSGGKEYLEILIYAMPPV